MPCRLWGRGGRISRLPTFPMHTLSDMNRCTGWGSSEWRSGHRVVWMVFHRDVSEKSGTLRLVAIRLRTVVLESVA